MTEVRLSSKAKLPEFAAYPLPKDKFEQCLHDLPQETIEVRFMSWSADTRFQRKIGKGKRQKLGLMQQNKVILWAQYSFEEWAITVYPVRMTALDQVRDILIEEGLTRLHDWFTEQAFRSNALSPAHE